MRRVLPALIVVLLVGLFFVWRSLRTFEPRDEPRVERDAEREVERRSAPAVLEGDASEHASGEREPVRDPTVATATVVADGEGCRLEVTVIARDATGSVDQVVLVCHDELGRAVRIERVEPPLSNARRIDFPSDGKVRFEARLERAGEFALLASALGRVDARQRITIGAEERVRSIELELAAAPPLRVRWQDSTGQPIERALAQSGEWKSVLRLGLAVSSTRREPGTNEPWLVPRFMRVVNAGSFSAAATSMGSVWPNSPEDAFAVLGTPWPRPFWLIVLCGDFVVDAQRIEPETREIVIRTELALLQKSTASLALCVVDRETRQPILDAQLESSTRLLKTPLALESGCTTGARIEAGLGRLSCKAPGYASRVIEVDLHARATSPLEIALERACPLLVRSVDASGARVPNVSFRLRELALQRTSTIDEIVYTTDERGEASIEDAPTGALAVIVHSPKLARHASIAQVCPSTGARTFDLVAVEGTEIGVALHDPTCVDAVVHVTDVALVPVATVSLPTSANGSVRLLPGEYLARLVCEGREGATVKFEVGDEPFVLVLRE